MKNKFLTSLHSILIVSALSSGCSFSKDSHETSQPISIQKQTSRIPSDVQKLLLLGIKNNSPNQVTSIVSRFEDQDFDFSDLSETPASLSIKLNLPGILLTLKDLGVDISHLGDQTELYTEKVLRKMTQETLSGLGHQEQNDISFKLNAAEDVIYTHQIKLTEKALSEVTSDDLVSAHATVQSSRLDGKTLCTQIILLAQKNDSKNFVRAEELLKTLGCNLTVQETRRLYHVELIRQFQGKFKNPALLSFIFRQKSLVEVLWNMDNSGLWISPQLLFRIANSEENNDVKKIIPDNCEEDCSIYFEEKPNYMKSLGLPHSDFELIDLRPNKPKKSYAYIRDEFEEDVFFQRVSTFMKGKKPKVSESNEDFWIVEASEINQ